MTQLSRRKFIGAAGAGLAAVAVAASSSVAAASPTVAPPGDSLAPYQIGRFTPPSADRSRSWNVQAGFESNDMAIDGMAYFPKDIWINAGDDVTWTINSAEPHTITMVTPALFGVYDKLLAAPFSAGPSGGSTFDNPMSPTLYNSGTLLNAPKMNTYSLTFAIPGDFAYTCLYHTNMMGTVHVRPANTPYPFSQAYYDAEGWVQKQEILRHGTALIGQAQAGASHDINGPIVMAGFGDGGVSLMRFYPEVVTVKVGKVVTWTQPDVIEVHTVTFGPEPPNPDEAEAPIYPGAPNPPGPQQTPFVYDGDRKTTVHSGFLYWFIPWGPTFKMIFSKPGEYSYRCVLHDEMGMVGKVVVVP